jgi:hypothetical protein
MITCVAPVAEAVRIDEFPAITEVGFAVTVTTGGLFTVTATLAVAFPPDPVALAV